MIVTFHCFEFSTSIVSNVKTPEAEAQLLLLRFPTIIIPSGSFFQNEVQRIYRNYFHPVLSKKTSPPQKSQDIIPISVTRPFPTLCVTGKLIIECNPTIKKFPADRSSEASNLYRRKKRKKQKFAQERTPEVWIIKVHIHCISSAHNSATLGGSSSVICCMAPAIWFAREIVRGCWRERKLFISSLGYWLVDSQGRDSMQPS